jgi:hypothetical protein
VVAGYLATDIEGIHLKFMKTSRKIHGRPATIQVHRSDEYSAIVSKLHPPFFTQKGPG